MSTNPSVIHASLPEKFKAFQELVEAAVKVLTEIKGDKGDNGISVELSRKGNDLIARYSDGTETNLGNIKGEDAIPPTIDYVKIIEAVYDKIKLPDIPTRQEIFDQLPSLETAAKAVAKYLLDNKDMLPVADPVTAEAVALALKEKGLVKDGEPGVAPTVEEISAKVLESIEVPAAPTAEAVAQSLAAKVVETVTERIKLPGIDDIAKIVLPQIKVPVEKDIVEKVLSEIPMPTNGKDSPLVDFLKGKGVKTIIQDSRQESILDLTFEDGLHVVDLTISGTTPDLIGCYSYKLQLILRCINKSVVKMKENIIYAPVVTNNDLSTKFQLEGNRLIIFGSGIKGSETIWTVTALTQSN